MMTKRIIPCLDVKDGVVVKGVQFEGHKKVGEILELALHYQEQGADELVFYEIAASAAGRSLDVNWVEKVGVCLNIPFCVAGGIRDPQTARKILNLGADKVSINSPALERPELISDLVSEFGRQSVVVGVDSKRTGNGEYEVFLYSGDPQKTRFSSYKTFEWLREVQRLGAGEVVLNCMNADGVGSGYDIEQLKMAREILTIPLVASGGARTVGHFVEVFQKADVDAALAAGVFHRGELSIPFLKDQLGQQNIGVRR